MFISILWRLKLRHREVRCLAQGHTGTKRIPKTEFQRLYSNYYAVLPRENFLRKGKPYKAEQGALTFICGGVLENESGPEKEREDQRCLFATVPGKSKKNSYGCQKSEKPACSLLVLRRVKGGEPKIFLVATNCLMGMPAAVLMMQYVQMAQVW